MQSREEKESVHLGGSEFTEEDKARFLEEVRKAFEKAGEMVFHYRKEFRSVPDGNNGNKWEIKETGHGTLKLELTW